MFGTYKAKSSFFFFLSVFQIKGKLVITTKINQNVTFGTDGTDGTDERARKARIFFLSKVGALDLH